MTLSTGLRPAPAESSIFLRLVQGAQVTDLVVENLPLNCTVEQLSAMVLNRGHETRPLLLAPVGCAPSEPHLTLAEAGIGSGSSLWTSAESSTWLRWSAVSTVTDGWVPESGRIQLDRTRTVGRSPESDLRLSHRGVSRRAGELMLRHGAPQYRPCSDAERPSRCETRPSDLTDSWSFFIGPICLRFQPLENARPFLPSLSPPVPATAVEEVRLVAPDLPAPLVKPPIPWLGIGLPLLVVAALLLFSDFGSGAFGLASVGFLALSPLLMIASHLDQLREARRTRRNNVAEFERALAELTDTATGARNAELKLLVASPQCATDRVSQVLADPPICWQAGRSEVSSLAGLLLRVGTGPRPSGVRVEYKWSLGVAESGWSERVMQLAEDVGNHAEAPLHLELFDMRRIGLVGAVPMLRSALCSIVTQLACSMDPARLRIEVDDLTSQHLDWIHWLPHVNAVRSTTHDFLEREATDSHSRQPVGNQPQVLLRVRSIPDRSVEFAGRSDGAYSSGTWSIPADDVAEVECVDIWCATGVELLPNECEVVLGDGAMVDLRTGVSQQLIRLELLDSAIAEQVAQRLRFLWSGDHSRMAKQGIPAQCSLLEICEQSGGRLDEQLTVALGIGRDGLFSVDLDRDGPHILVAGTTGSGKSELLQSLVVSLANNYGPHEVSFVLIDFKGGAALGVCATLPHVAGVLTDLELAAVARVVVSLRAELRRREVMLAQHHAKDLAQLRQRLPAIAPARLIVVIDEFATLREEMPESMEALVDIARRGRSLGIHLVLGTQRPSGVVDDHLRANVTLRIALRTVTHEDSVEVIGSNRAAEISAAVPGRALVVGRAESRGPELVQIAYGGAPPRQTQGPVVRRFRHLDDLRRSVSGSPGQANPHSGRSEVEHLVRHLARQWDLQNPGQPRPRYWRDPLPEHLTVEDCGDPTQGHAVVAGLVDLPSESAQEPWSLSLGPITCVIGPHGSGRSTALSTLASQWLRGEQNQSCRPRSVDALVNSTKLPVWASGSWASVVGHEDLDRTRRLLRILLRELDLLSVDESAAERADESGGERSRAAQNCAVDQGVSVDRLLIIDDLDLLVGRLERLSDVPLMELLEAIVDRSSRSGLKLLVSAHSLEAVPTRWRDRISAPLSLGVVPLHLQDRHALPRSTPTTIPGRGTHLGLEVQVANRSPTWTATAAGSITHRGVWRGRSVDRVGALPARISSKDLGRFAGIVRLERSTAERVQVVCGIDTAFLEPVFLDLSPGALLVAGPKGSGKSHALTLIAEQLLVVQHPYEVVSLDCGEVRTPLGELYDRIGSLSEAMNAGQQMLVLLDNLSECTDGTHGGVAEALHAMLVAARQSGSLLVGAVDASRARMQYSGIVAEMKRDRRAVLLQPDRELDGDLVGVRLPRHRELAETPGRGIMVTCGDLVPVALAEPW